MAQIAFSFSAVERDLKLSFYPDSGQSTELFCKKNGKDGKIYGSGQAFLSGNGHILYLARTSMARIQFFRCFPSVLQSVHLSPESITFHSLSLVISFSHMTARR